MARTETQRKEEAHADMIFQEEKRRQRNEKKGGGDQTKPAKKEVDPSSACCSFGEDPCVCSGYDSES